MNKITLKDIIIILTIIISTFTITKCTNTQEPIKTNNSYLYEVIYQQQVKLSAINDSLHILNDSNNVLKENYMNIQEKYLTSLKTFKTSKFKTIRDTVEVEVYPADIVEQLVNDCDSLNLITMKTIEVKDLLIDQLGLKINELEYTENVYKTIISNHIENEKAAIKRHKKQKHKAFIGGLGTGLVTGLVIGGIIF